MEIWLSGADKPAAKSKKPTILTLIDGDCIAVRAHADEVELSRDDLKRICRLAFKDVLSYEDCVAIAKEAGIPN